MFLGLITLKNRDKISKCDYIEYPQKLFELVEFCMAIARKKIRGETNE